MAGLEEYRKAGGRPADYRRAQTAKRAQDEDCEPTLLGGQHAAASAACLRAASACSRRSADHCLLLPDLTPFEHNVVKKSAFLGVVSNVTWALMDSALNAKLLAIANNDPIAIAKANSIHWSVNAALQLFISPLGAAASDTWGRKWFIAVNRLSTITYFAGCFLCKTLNHYVIACIICWGLLDPLTGAAEQASWSDVFGERPELSSRIRVKYMHMSDAVATFITPLLGAAITQRSAQSSHPLYGQGNLGFVLSMVCCVAQSAVAMTFPETLPTAEGRAELAAYGQELPERKPFSLLVANPISNALCARCCPLFAARPVSTALFAAGCCLGTAQGCGAWPCRRSSSASSRRSGRRWSLTA